MAEEFSFASPLETGGTEVKTETTKAPPQSGASDSGTIAAGNGESGKTETAVAAPAEGDWRKRLAGEDADALKRLSRFADEGQFFKSYRALEQKLSSGEYKQVQPYPEKGTDEEKSAWRQANGIPDKPDAYLADLKLPNGVVPGENDKPGLERLAAFAQNKNWSKDQYAAVVEAYYSEMEAAQNAREAADDQFHQTAEDTLRADWGPQDYRRNVNAIHNLLGAAPEDVRTELFGGRTASGQLIGDHPGVLKWLAQVALDVNPAAKILPAGVSADGVKSRLEQLEAMVKDSSSEYYTGVNAPQLRKEYLQLLETQNKLQGRAA